MKQKIFVVYDDKAKAYLPPFFLPEIGMATRAFGDCVNDATHNFGRHPEDYTLFMAGTFDDSSGAFDIEGTLLCVAHGLELRKRVEADVMPIIDRSSPQTELRFVPGNGAAGAAVVKE